jgi:AsmA protein
MKILKFALLGLAALALVIAGVGAYLVFTFDARDFSPRIVQLVKDKTARTLRIEGAIKLSFWPDIGVRLGPVSLTERASEEPFARVDNARLAVRLLPLLSGELVADEISVEGAHVGVTRYQDGRLNIDDLFESGGGDLQFEIGRVTVKRSAVSYRDLADGKGYELSGIAVETGRIANRVAFPVTLTLNAQDSAHTFDLDVVLKGRHTFDLQQKTYLLQDGALEASGRLPGVVGLSARVTGTVAARVKDGEIKTKALTAAVKGTMLGETMDARLDASSVVVGAARALGEAVRVDMRATGTAGMTHMRLAMPFLERNANAFRSEAVTLELELHRGNHIIKATGATPLEGDLAQRTLFFNALQASFAVTGPRLSQKGISGALSGAASIDAAKEGVHVKMAGKVADSQFKALIASAGFARPVYTFAVDIDEVDLGRYAAADTGKQKAAGGLDLTPLATLPASGTLHVGVLKSAGLKASNVELVLKP